MLFTYSYNFATLTKSKYTFVCRSTATTDHIPRVRFCQFIMAHIPSMHTMLLPCIQYFRNLVLEVLYFEADVDMGVFGVGISVGKFCDGSWVYLADHVLKTARSFGNNDIAECLGLLTELSAVADEAQAIKVDICAGYNGNMRTSCFQLWVKGQIFLSSCE